MDSLRLAELLTGLSMVADIGMGLQPGEAGRAVLVAMEIADALGVEDPPTVYYTTLLQHVGCTGYAHEAAAMLGGDEIAVERAALRTDFGDPREILRGYLPLLAPTSGIGTRVRVAAIAALRARAIVRGYSAANCEVAARTAERSGLPPAVQSALLDIYEQWDGKGGPNGDADEAIAKPARIAQVAIIASLFHTLGGPGAATEALNRRAGASLDPVLAGLVVASPGRFLAALDEADALDAAVEAEPDPSVRIGEPELDRVCRAFGEAVDLKTPLHHGHSSGVAELAAAAAERLGVPATDKTAIRRAGFVHDLGWASVSNGVWERPGPLRRTEREQVRLHPHYTERVLARCGPLAGVAALAGAHHERLDGSGYHRQLTAGDLTMSARVLAASDAMQAMCQARAHRPARTSDEAAHVLAQEAIAGLYDLDAVRAVVEAAGSSTPRLRVRRPADLTERQLEVLRLVARGLSNPQIAEQLVISRRTAEHHVQDIYARIGSRLGQGPRCLRCSTICSKTGRSADALPARARDRRVVRKPARGAIQHGAQGRRSQVRRRIPNRRRRAGARRVHSPRRGRPRQAPRHRTRP